MRVIDANGRLFGRINVYDALVILLVLGAVAGGVALLVVPGEEGTDEVAGEPATRYATVDLGSQSPAVAERLAGDDAAADVEDGLSITDAYVGPAAGDEVSVLVRVRINGTVEEAGESDGGGDGENATFAYAGEPLRSGDKLAFGSVGDGVRGEVMDLSTTGATLDASSLPGEAVERTVVVRAANVTPAIADGIEVGMVDRRDGEPVARVTGVRTEPASIVLTSDDGNIYEREHPRNRDAFLTVELQVREIDDRLTVGTSRVRLGSTLALDFGTAAIGGTVVTIQAP